mmetsp:Transcript_29020/g.42619  ORF Transcript_29020/g.42619 Transcript_29020/m.42619 type:complete len:293 (+) Transcript_29020:69-947(+)
MLHSPTVYATIDECADEMSNKSKNYNLATYILVTSFIFSWICWCLLLDSTKAFLRRRMLSFCDTFNHHDILLARIGRRVMCSKTYGPFAEDISISILHFMAYMSGVLSLITAYSAYRISTSPTLTYKNEEEWISNKLGLRPPFENYWKSDAPSVPYSPLELKREMPQVAQEGRGHLKTCHKQSWGKYKTNQISTDEQYGAFPEHDLFDLPDFCLSKIQNEFAKARLQVYFDLFIRTKNVSRFTNEVYIMHAAGDIAGCNPSEFLARLGNALPEQYSSLLEREQQSHPHIYFG